MTQLHICLVGDAPGGQSPPQLGARRVCDCGRNYIWREGSTRGGLQASWWPAPPQPRQRRAVRSLLFGPRKG